MTRFLWAAGRGAQLLCYTLGVLCLVSYDHPDWAAAMFSLGTFYIAWEIRAKMLERER